MRKERRKFSDEFKQKIVDRVSSGERQKDIAEEIKAPPTLISRWVKEAGKTKKIRKKSTSELAAILPMLQNVTTPHGDDVVLLVVTRPVHVSTIVDSIFK